MASAGGRANSEGESVLSAHSGVAVCLCQVLAFGGRYLFLIFLLRLLLLPAEQIWGISTPSARSGARAAGA